MLLCTCLGLMHAEVLVPCLRVVCVAFICGSCCTVFQIRVRGVCGSCCTVFEIRVRGVYLCRRAGVGPPGKTKTVSCTLLLADGS